MHGNVEEMTCIFIYCHSLNETSLAHIILLLIYFFILTSLLSFCLLIFLLSSSLVLLLKYISSYRFYCNLTPQYLQLFCEIYVTLWENVFRISLLKVCIFRVAILSNKMSTLICPRILGILIKYSYFKYFPT